MPNNTKTDEFSEKFQKFVLQNLDLWTGLFDHENGNFWRLRSQLKKLQYNFPKMRGDSSENSSVLEVRGIPYGQCFVIFLKDLCLAMIMRENPQKNYPLWPIYLEHKLWATFSLSHIFIQPTFSLHVTVHHVHVHEKRGSEWKKWVWVKKWAEWKSGPSEKSGWVKSWAKWKSGLSETIWTTFHNFD